MLLFSKWAVRNHLLCFFQNNQATLMILRELAWEHLYLSVSQPQKRKPHTAGQERCICRSGHGGTASQWEEETAAQLPGKSWPIRNQGSWPLRGQWPRKAFLVRGYPGREWWAPQFYSCIDHFFYLDLSFFICKIRGAPWIRFFQTSFIWYTFDIFWHIHVPILLLRFSFSLTLCFTHYLPCLKTNCRLMGVMWWLLYF